MGSQMVVRLPASRAGRALYHNISPPPPLLISVRGWVNPTPGRSTAGNIRKKDKIQLMTSENVLDKYRRNIVNYKMV
jgi:hypothetical protein